jgi:hypothetical protein
MKFVATKTADQLDLQVLHRLRERLISQRTGIINRTALSCSNAVLRSDKDYGSCAPTAAHGSHAADMLSVRMVRVIGDLAEDWRLGFWPAFRADALSGVIVRSKASVGSTSHRMIRAGLRPDEAKTSPDLVSGPGTKSNER